MPLSRTPVVVAAAVSGRRAESLSLSTGFVAAAAFMASVVSSDGGGTLLWTGEGWRGVTKVGRVDGQRCGHGEGATGVTGGGEGGGTVPWTR